jgi:hypothetical protein
MKMRMMMMMMWEGHVALMGIVGNGYNILFRRPQG